MNFPDNLRYTKEHEWIRLEGAIGVIGVTDYAQGELGDVVFVELPAPGRQLKQGETFGTVEAVKAVSDLYSPVAGEVLETNALLEKQSEAVNKDPYGTGWMIKLRLKDPAEAAALLTAAQYRDVIGK
jgi:glycine cleavage system H protein